MEELKEILNIALIIETKNAQSLTTDGMLCQKPISVESVIDTFNKLTEAYRKQAVLADSKE